MEPASACLHQVPCLSVVQRRPTSAVRRILVFLVCALQQAPHPPDPRSIEKLNFMHSCQTCMRRVAAQTSRLPQKREGPGESNRRRSMEALAASGMKVAERQY
jgi:hypothetical protein